MPAHRLTKELEDYIAEKGGNLLGPIQGEFVGELKTPDRDEPAIYVVAENVGQGAVMVYCHIDRENWEAMKRSIDMLFAGAHGSA